MTTKLWRPKGSQFEDNVGGLLAGGTFTYFDATTTSPQTVWKDSGASSAWTQPITLDSSGRLTDSIYVGTASFKEVAKTSAGGTLWSEDSIPGATAVVTTTYALPATPVLTKASNYVLTTSDLGKLIETDTTGGDFTLTLPSAITANSTVSGGHYWVQQVGTAGKVTLATAGGQTVNGVGSLSLTRPYSSWIVITDGANWAALSADFPYATLSKTTTYTVTTADRGKCVKCDTSGGAWSLNLPSASSAGDGFEVVAIKTTSDANAVTIDPNSTETVNGSTANATALLVQWDAVKLRCDGSNWQVIGSSNFFGLKVGIAANNLLALTSAGLFPAMPAGPVPQPQGRLTVTSGTPVINADVSGSTSVYYTPYVGQICAVYDGANLQMFTFSEQTLTLTTAAPTANMLYDFFAFSNSGTFTIGVGPAWTAGAVGGAVGNYVSAGSLTTSSAARGTGAASTELQMKQGLWTNKVAISLKNGASTYSVAANQATLLGTVWTDAAGAATTCHVSFGQNRKWGVWNAYNRKLASLLVGDTTATWAGAGTNVFRAWRGQTANSGSVVSGLAEDYVNAATRLSAQAASGGGTSSSSIGIASLTVASGSVGVFAVSSGTTTPAGECVSDYRLVPFIGCQAFTALEKTDAANTLSVVGAGPAGNQATIDFWA